MTITTVYELGEPFLVTDEQGVFRVRQNPAGPKERAVGVVMGCAFLGFAAFINVVSFEGPAWIVPLMTVVMGAIGLGILWLSLSKTKKLQYVELDTQARALRYGEERDGVRHVTGEMPLDQIERVKVEYAVDTDEMAVRAKDGKIDRGFSRLYVRGPGEAPRKGEILTGDYYILDTLRGRIETALH